MLNPSVSWRIYFNLVIRLFSDSTSDHFWLPTDAFSLLALASASFAFVSSSVAFFSASSVLLTFWRAASISFALADSLACILERFSFAAARFCAAFFSASSAADTLLIACSCWVSRFTSLFISLSCPFAQPTLRSPFFQEAKLLAVSTCWELYP